MDINWLLRVVLVLYVPHSSLYPKQTIDSPMAAHTKILAPRMPSSPYIRMPEKPESFYKELAQRIWRNESGCSIQKLVWWNEGESFMSLGIGHFLWFPKKCIAPFTPTFVSLLNFMKQHGKKIPDWLEATKEHCPWTDRQQVVDGTDYRLPELRHFLQDTIILQTRFIVDRFEKSSTAILVAVPCKHRSLFKQRIATLAGTPQGLYALIDYVNFKGDGTNKKERYHKKGWGLLQVIAQIDSSAFENNPRAAFVACAKRLLVQRVENAPPERGEKRWLAGWVNRLHTYL